MEMRSDPLELPVLVAGPDHLRARVLAVLGEHAVAAVGTTAPWSELGVPDQPDATVLVVCGELSEPASLVALRGLRARCAAARIVVVVPGPDDARLARRAIRARVDGVVVEAHLATALIPTIDAVLAEQVVMPREVRPHLPLDLSSREREILTLVARGWTNAAIGAELLVAESTVKSHMTRILAKLGVSSRAEAVRLMIEGDGLAPVRAADTATGMAS